MSQRIREHKREQVRPGLIESSRSLCAIVVHYEAWDDECKEARSKKKIIRLENKLDRDAYRLAEDIIRQHSDIISGSKRNEIEILISNLQEEYMQNPDAKENIAAAKEMRRQEKLRRQRASDFEEPADMEKIDDYIELLYTDENINKKERKNRKNLFDDKIRGTDKILELCCYVGNLEILVQNNPLMRALSRVLSDDHTASVPLAYNITRIFLALSNFAEMHAFLVQHKIGSICCQILEYEVKRSAHREDEQNDLAKKALDSRNDDDLHYIREKQRSAASRSRSLQKKQDKLLEVALLILMHLAEEPSIEYKMVRKKYFFESLSALFAYSSSVPLLSLLAKFLRKLSIFEESKERMANTELVSRLARFVPCPMPQLGVPVLALLFNLSFDADCRQQMAGAGLITKLVAPLREVPKYRAPGLRILYHLSIENSRKPHFALAQDCVQTVMQLILCFPPNDKLPRELAALAINLSLHPANAEIICRNKGLNQLFDRVQRTKDALLLKLIRNISLWTFQEQQQLLYNQGAASPNSSAMIINEEDEEKDEEEEKRELKSNTLRDSFASSICSSTSSFHNAHYVQRGLWSRLVAPLLSMAINSESSHDMLVEVLGTLGNLTTMDLPRGTSWARLLGEYNLTGFLSKLLVMGMSQYDVVLEAVIFTGVLATDPEAAALIASSSLARALEELWRDRGDDAGDEIILQLLFTFQRLLSNRRTHDELLHTSRVHNEIFDCLEHPNPEINFYADACLDLILEHDRDEESAILGELGAQVRQKRFISFNAQWLHIEQRQSTGGGRFSPENLRYGPPNGFSSEEEEEEDEDEEPLSEADSLSPSRYNRGWGAKDAY